MGRRRIRLIKKYFMPYEVHGTDQNDQRRADVAREFGIPVWESAQEALQRGNFECAFICTSPLSHAKLIGICLENGVNVFTEINLVAKGYQENMKLAEEKGLLLFLSSSMIYRDEMQYLARELKKDNKYSYTYHVGQYLSDWHPWENYQDFFVGDKETNGCREILAIELPWITRVFGEVKEIKCMCNKVTNLDIDYNDCYMILLQHKNGTIGTFCVDVVSCEPIRSLKIIGEDIYISWEGDSDSFFRKDGSSKELINIFKFSLFSILV